MKVLSQSVRYRVREVAGMVARTNSRRSVVAVLKGVEGDDDEEVAEGVARSFEVEKQPGKVRGKGRFEPGFRHASSTITRVIFTSGMLYGAFIKV